MRQWFQNGVNGADWIQVAHDMEQHSHFTNMRFGSSVKTVTLQGLHLEAVIVTLHSHQSLAVLFLPESLQSKYIFLGNF
jgi:hypothetical protein